MQGDKQGGHGGPIPSAPGLHVNQMGVILQGHTVPNHRPEKGEAIMAVAVLCRTQAKWEPSINGLPTSLSSGFAGIGR